MPKILDRIDKRFQVLREAADDLSWKSMPELMQHMQMNGGEGEVGPGYHALRAEAGPCTANPVWARDWTSPSGHTYPKGTPAPQWTEQEIHVAMAPQIRTWARSQSKNAFGGKHNARQNKAWVDDCAMNMHTRMQQALQQEKDEGRILGGGGFVSWISSIIREAGETGVGGTTAQRNALGRVGELLRCKDPAKAQAIADRVSPEYRERASHKLDDGNPYGQFSPEIYQLGSALAQALQAGDQAAVDEVKKQLLVLDDGKGEWGNGKIKDSMNLVQGTDTGRRDISTPHGAEEGSEAKADLDKLMHTGIASVDTPMGDDGGTLGTMLVGQKGLDMSGMDNEVVYKALELGREWYFMAQKNPALMQKMKAEGRIPIGDGDFRYLIRLLAPWIPGGDYPGKGVPGKDPEIGKSGQPSQWLQSGQPHMMERTDIINDIASGSAGGSISLQQITALGRPPLTPVETDYVALICGVHPDAPGKPMSQAEVSRFRNVSKANVSPKVKKAAAKIGKTMEEVMDMIKMQAGAGGEAAAPVSKDPLAIFQKWMQEYEADADIDESAWIDRKIINECYRAVCRLHFWLTVKPIIEGKVVPVLLSRRTMGRV